MHRFIAPVFTFFIALSAAAQYADTTAAAVSEWKSEALERSIKPDTACAAGTIACGETKSGRVSVDSCESNLLYAVGYSFNGTAGQRITVSATSNDFAMTVVLGDGRVGQPTAIYARDDVFVRGQTASFTTTLPYTGAYIILVTPGTTLTFGNYSLTVTCAGSGTSTGTNSQVVPIVGHLTGSGGSVFRSDLKLMNSSSSTISGVLVFTPRGQSASPSDPQVRFVLGAGQTRFFEDVYRAAQSGDGAARLTIVPDANAAGLIADTSTYTFVPGGGELGQSPTIFTRAQFWSAGTTVAAFLGKSGERTNVFIVTGDADTTIEWRYRNENGTLGAPVIRSYAANATHQVSAVDLVGFTPASNTILQATIQNGSARVALSPVNNVSNQGRWVDFKTMP